MISDEAEKVRQFLLKRLQGRTRVVLDEHTKLFEANVLDSFGVLELFAFLEDTFHVRLEKDEINPENVATIEAILNFIRSRKEPRGSEWRVSE